MNLLITRLLRYTFLLLSLFIFGLGCQCTAQQQNGKRSRSPQNTKIEAQRDFLKKERESIETYIEDRSLDMTRTGTGLYYNITLDNPSADSAETGDEVTFAYNIYLLNGTLIYSSESKGLKTLVVDKQDAEIGLHESLKLMSVGDEGLFILPSHLAFGVAGDQIRVPPKTALAYEIKIIEIKKTKKQ